MENFLLLIVGGVLMVYFFSAMSVYKSLYRKMNEEKAMLEEQNDNMQRMVEKYQKQIKGSIGSLDTLQKNLQQARDDLQAMKVENIDLKHENDNLERKVEELYAQVNAMI